MNAEVNLTRTYVPMWAVPQHQPLLLTASEVEKWRTPEFQRVTRLNSKVKELAEHIRATQVLPGELVLGRLRSDPNVLYILDGKHRLLAFDTSGVPEVYAETRTETFEKMAEMAKRYRELNSSLRRMTADDVVKAVEEENSALRHIRICCKFVGYDIRRHSRVEVVSMSSLLRAWDIARAEVPNTASRSAVDLAQELSAAQADVMVDFLNVAHIAWGRELDTRALWKTMNITLCIWLYLRLVKRHMVRGSNWTFLETPIFGKCLASLTTKREYLEWLVGRGNMSDEFRAPCYERITAAFALALHAEGITNPIFPSPAWACR